MAEGWLHKPGAAQANGAGSSGQKKPGDITTRGLGRRRRPAARGEMDIAIDSQGIFCACIGVDAYIFYMFR